jgi:serine/threonine protein kinase
MWIPDRTLAHLRVVTDEPDFSGTRYRLIEPIGRGGMGTVYRARDTVLERDVALKVLHLPDTDPGLAGRLVQEARILAGLEHPGIVPVHDAGTLPDGRVWYAMKRVLGERLDRLAAGPLERSERLRIFQRICEAVAFAHAHGVLHRDLKPANVMAGAFGEVLVLDWGVAKRADGVAGDVAGPGPPRDSTPLDPETLQGTRFGTPGWMSPEQERGETDRIDERTDVFGLGRILLFLLEPEGAPPRLRAIGERAATADPEQRYPDVAALNDDVARYLAGLPVEAYRESLLERAARVLQPYRAAILLVLAYLLMRVLLLAFFRA